MDILAQELHAPVKRKFPKRKVLTFYKNETWSADLIDYSKDKQFNNGYSYVLVVIDNYTRYCWAFPLKQKTSQEILNAFKSINEIPISIWTDKGTEFYNKYFKHWCKENKIRHYSTYGDSKAVMAERLIKTLKTWLEILRTENLSKNWIDYLDQVVQRYNNRVHSTIKLKPVDVYHQNLKLEGINEDTRKIRDRDDLKVGDYVRISRLKTPFEKGFNENYTDERFIISEIKHTKPLTYVLKEEDGIEIEGSFYRQELLKSNTDVHRVEKIIKSKFIHGVRHDFVKWKGVPAKYNSWVSSENALKPEWN